MSDGLYLKYLEKCLDEPPGVCETWALTGGEIVAAVFPFAEQLKPHFQKIFALPYDARFEPEADAAIVSYIFDSADWQGLSAQAWRVLLERFRQALVYFQLHQDEPFVPIPAVLPETHYTGAVWLFVIHQMKLPLPIASSSDLITWSDTLTIPIRGQ